jgi:DNA-binding IclR family transcriptional regulator
MAAGLAGGLALLRHFASAGKPLSVPEAVERSGLNRTTVYRMVEELVAAGWLRIEPDQTPKRYAVSWDVAMLGLRALRSNHIRDGALPHLIALARRSRRPSGLGFYEAGLVVMTDQVSVVEDRIMPTPQGERYPAAATAAGKALLAFQSEAEIQRVAANGLPAFTDRSRVSAEEIRADLDRVRERGWAMNEGEYDRNLGALAAPIFDSRRQAVAALAVRCMPGTPDAVVQDLAHDLLIQTTLASAEFGYRPTNDDAAV